MDGATASVRHAPATKAAAIERLKTLGRAYVEAALEHPALFRLMFGIDGLAAFAPEERAPTPDRRAFTLLGEALDELVARGVMLRQHRPGAELHAWAMVHGVAALMLGGAVEFDRRAIESCLDFVVRGVVAPARGGRRTKRA